MRDLTKVSGEREIRNAGKNGRYWSSGPIRVFFFAYLLYEHGIYTHVVRVANRNSISGRCVEKCYREVRDFEVGMNIQNVPRTHTYHLSLCLTLPPFSIPCRVRSTPAKTKFNCDRAKGLFFSFFSFLYVANLPCAGRNKRQCTASPLSARACIRGERVCVCR